MHLIFMLIIMFLTSAVNSTNFAYSIKLFNLFINYSGYRLLDYKVYTRRLRS